MREGSIVKWSKHDEELRGVVIAPPKLEDKQISAIEIKTRETVTVRSYIYMYNCKSLSLSLSRLIEGILR